MIMLLGGIQVIIKEIDIYKLHGEYDYQVKFDTKLTFLFGPNGCGKTTILNILASIVTGKLYNLVDYVFDEIELRYTNEKGKIDQINISIKKSEDDTQEMIISFEGDVCEIKNIGDLKERMFRRAEEENLDKAFNEMYPFAQDIKSIFNYVYLPLNRYGTEMLYDEREYYRYYGRRRYYNQQPYNAYLNDSLRYVSGLIRDNCMNINVKENKINDKFRKEVLSSMIRVSSDMPVRQIIKEIANFNWDEVLKSKTTYIKTLEEIGVYDEKLKEKIEDFFTQFKAAYTDYENEKNNERTGIGIDLAWQYAEFLKIKNVADLAKENEKIKENIRKPREMFLEVINDFFLNSGTDKKIMISSEGQVYFDSHNGRLKMTNLSSGEKQIIITFASLIFGLKGKSTGIFIVDEPEASLHLEWQQKFVPAILKTNENIQLIFATHSPEMIGKYRNKAVKLTREQ